MTASVSGTVVVVGGGLAGAKAVQALREFGHQGRIVLFGDERHLPYERPPLSKGFLTGADSAESAVVHSEDWYSQHDVDLRLGDSVMSIDVGQQSVMSRSESTKYDRLLLATGASPRRLPMADDSGAQVAYLRTLDDSERIKAMLAPGRRIAIIGGGWIGLEVASAARQAGVDVTVVESLPLPLTRVLGPEIATVFATLHRQHGVDLRTGAEVRRVTGGADRSQVHLADGSVVDADLVLVGIGVAPNTGIAESAGLAVDNGILTDATLSTSAPGVFAAGDVANAHHPRLGRRLRVEHWDNAIQQGVLAGRNLLGHELPYESLPYFFSDQYDVGIEYVGSVGPDGYDEVVVRGDTNAFVFTAFWLKAGRVVAGMHANDWDAVDEIRRLVGADRVDLPALRDGSLALASVPAEPA
jgi:3-phenylpropionate/trans-cinnamate dioxygenase ferredoxin reductase subunit